MCGCRKNVKNATAAPLQRTSKSLVENVPLNLCSTEKLPTLFKGGYNGTDVVVHMNTSSQPFNHAINIFGRTAKVAPDIKNALVSQWPDKFCEATG